MSDGGKEQERGEIPQGALRVSLLAELSQRRVLRVSVIYAAVAWSITEAVSFLFEALPVFPAWSNALVAILFVVGFPVAMFLAWRFDIAPDGIKRTEASSARGRFTIAGALLLLVGTTAGLFYLLYPSIEAETANAGEMTITIAPNGVAVLPFINASENPEDLYITEGLGDEVRDQLGRISGLRVAARSSSVAFRAQEIGARAIAQRLGVKWLIESTLRRQGDRLRISVQIIDGETGFQAWSQSFDRTVSDLLAIQQEIAGRVVAEILPDAADAVAASRSARINVSAHALMLLARHLEQQVRDRQRVDEELLDRAIELYRQAADADPSSALAHSRLAGALLYLGDLEAAEAPVLTALELDPDLSDVQFTLGLYHWLRRDSAGGAAFERAVALNPNNADAVSALAKWVWHSNRVEAGGELFRRALALDPMSLVRYSDLGNYYGITGQREQAVVVAERVVELFPDVQGQMVLARIFEVVGDVDEGIAWASKAHLSRPDLPDPAWQLAELYARIGDEDSARRYEPEPGASQLFFNRRYPELIDLAEELLFDNPNDIKLYYMLAFAYNTQGYYAEAARLLKLVGLPEVWLSDARRADGEEAMLTLISAQYRVGEADEARQHADTLIERMQLQIDDGAGRAWWTNFYESCSWAAMGENDRALDKLEVIVESPGLVWYPVLRDALCFQELTDHPRYQAVVAAIDARMRAIRERLPATLARHGVI
ncbi:MAG: tetratricopeptide repeat protein [Gammaproteobacteria bacterium]|nr:tetratricopeptide repeat protein [Gammaproteobacteria bacterium]